MPECPREARTASPATDKVRLGKRDAKGGLEAGPATAQGHVKKDPPSSTHPNTHPSVRPSIHLSICESIPVFARDSASVNVLARQWICKLLGLKEKSRAENVLEGMEAVRV